MDLPGLEPGSLRRGPSGSLLVHRDIAEEPALTRIRTHDRGIRSPSALPTELETLVFIEGRNLCSYKH